MRFVILLSALIFAACKGEAPGPDMPRPEFAANYAVIEGDSHIRFSATQEGRRFDGEFTDFDAVIYFDQAALDDSRVWVSVPLGSFDGGNADRNSNVPGTPWFDTKNHPTAIYESDSIRADGDSYIASGTLTLKGISQPVLFPFTLEQTGDLAVMNANFPINRTRWNIGAAPWDTEEYVGLDVMMDIRVAAEKAE